MPCFPLNNAVHIATKTHEHMRLWIVSKVHPKLWARWGMSCSCDRRPARTNIIRFISASVRGWTSQGLNSSGIVTFRKRFLQTNCRLFLCELIKAWRIWFTAHLFNVGTSSSSNTISPRPKRTNADPGALWRNNFSSKGNKPACSNRQNFSKPGNLGINPRLSLNNGRPRSMKSESVFAEREPRPTMLMDSNRVNSRFISRKISKYLFFPQSKISKIIELFLGRTLSASMKKTGKSHSMAALRSSTRHLLFVEEALACNIFQASFRKSLFRHFSMKVLTASASCVKKSFQSASYFSPLSILDIDEHSFSPPMRLQAIHQVQVLIWPVRPTSSHTEYGANPDTSNMDTFRNSVCSTPCSTTPNIRRIRIWTSQVLQSGICPWSLKWWTWTWTFHSEVKMAIRTANRCWENLEQKIFTSMNANFYFCAFPCKNQYWGPKVCMKQSLQPAGHKLWVHTTQVHSEQPSTVCSLEYLLSGGNVFKKWKLSTYIF